ncbi:NUDIX domain-containing protein [Jatrophihabitans sp. YIM 134969]
MAVRRSAGFLLYRRSSTGADVPGIDVLIGHMGGPLWARKDDGAWSVPKGEYTDDETPFDAARREFTEELGLPAPDGPALDLGEVRQSGGKTVRVWAVEADLDPADVVPGTFTMTWPPRSGRTAEFPELDRVEWCDPATATRRLVTAQRAFVERLLDQLPPGADGAAADTG